MKSEKNILIAFILNISFSLFEFVGGIFTNSVAIISDSIHDMGDAMSIGVSYFLERKSKRKPDEEYTYGYVRYSVIGSLITTVVLLISSIFVIYNAIIRINNPVEIHYEGMILFAVIGVIVNFLAAYFTKDGESLNQKAVNLHMLEDVLGWGVVLVGAIIMKFTDIKIIDPVLSILVSLFIFRGAILDFKRVLDLFLVKTPNDVSISELKNHILEIKGVKDVHHIHVWSIDGFNNYATMHIVVDEKDKNIKSFVKKELSEHGISHTTIEIESVDEKCHDEKCCIKTTNKHGHHHHHY